MNTQTNTSFVLPVGFTVAVSAAGLVLNTPKEAISCSVAFCGESHIRLHAVAANGPLSLPLSGLLPRLQGEEIKQLFGLWAGLNPNHAPKPAPKAQAPAPVAKAVEDMNDEEYIRHCFAKAKRG